MLETCHSFVYINFTLILNKWRKSVSEYQELGFLFSCTHKKKKKLLFAFWFLFPCFSLSLSVAFFFVIILTLIYWHVPYGLLCGEMANEQKFYFSMHNQNGSRSIQWKGQFVTMWAHALSLSVTVLSISCRPASCYKC